MRHRKTSRSNTRVSGFTLIELLVVIAIISLLIAILLPALSSSREQGKLTKCLSHARGLASAGAMFANDHQGRFQLVTSQQGNDQADAERNVYEYDSNGELLSWVTALAKVSGVGINSNAEWGVRANTFEDAQAQSGSMSSSFDAALCPSDQVAISTPFYPNGPQLAGSGNGGLYWGRLSFGINEDLVGAQDGSSSQPPVGRYDSNNPNAWRIGQLSPFAGERFMGALDQVLDPATMLLISEAGADDVGEATASGASGNADPSSVASLIISALATGPMLEHCMDKWPQRVPIKRHPGGAINVIFADFHGERAKPTGWRAASANSNLKTPKSFGKKIRVSPYRITGPVRELN